MTYDKKFLQNLLQQTILFPHCTLFEDISCKNINTIKNLNNQ